MYQKSKKTFLKHIDFIVIDYVVIAFSFILTYAMRFGWEMTYDTFVQLRTDNMYQSYLQVLLVVNLIVIVVTNPYSDILKRNMFQEIKKIIQYNIYLLLGSIIALYSMMAVEQYSRLLIFGYVIYSSGFMTIYRLFYKRFLRKKINEAEGKNNLLLVTSYAQIKNIMNRLYKSEINSVNLIGIILTETKEEKENFLAAYGEAAVTELLRAKPDKAMQRAEEAEAIPIVGTIEDLYEYVRTNVVDEVLICADNTKAQKIAMNLYDMGTTVHINVNNLIQMPHAILNAINGVPVITASMQYVTTGQLAIKRAMDVFFGLFGSLITIIVTLFVAPAILLADGRPVFFRQERVGRNGRLFRIWKFRSMYNDAEAKKADLLEQNKMDGGMFKMDDDPRIIGAGKKFSIGRFLRESSIDELPQFFNILAGSMSLVGTRPPLPGETSMYANNHKVRLAVKPGLTGMWQVSGRSDITDFEEVVRLDKEYIENFSLGLDIKIIAKTFTVVLGRKGSV